MKMKQVCEATGLTEKAIRLYMKQELVKPTVTEGLHNASYDFSQEDVHRLKIIAALRAAEFSMADIREILDHPEQLPDFLAEHRQLLEGDIRQKQAIAEALDRLSVEGRGNLDAAADVLASAKPTEPKVDLGPILGLIVCCLIVVGLSVWEETPVSLLLATDLLSIAGGALATVMSIRYFTCTLRAQRLPHRTVGTVVSIVKQTGFDGGFAIQTTAPIGAPNWAGRGGLWTLFFLLWNEVRPDHWMPVIQFTDHNGKPQSGSYPYGGLKHSFREGDKIEISWDKYPQRVLPLAAPWLKIKALVYFLLGLAALTAGIVFFPRVFEIMEQVYR